MNRAFTPPKVKSLEPRIREVAEQPRRRLHRPMARSSSSTSTACCCPLTIIAECLGVADDELPKFKQWSDDFVAAIGNHDMSKEQLRSLLLSQFEFFVYFGDKIVERRAEPRDDLISDVVHATPRRRAAARRRDAGDVQPVPRGRQRDDHEAASPPRCSSCSQRPELQAELRADPSLIPGFIEEALRLEPPVQGLYRTAVVDTEVGGVPIPAGAHLMLVYAAGNRDERKFPDPEQVDPCRRNAMSHLAFGHGEHFCLGAALARAEGRIGLEVLLERLDDLRRRPGSTSTG